MLNDESVRLAPPFSTPCGSESDWSSITYGRDQLMSGALKTRLNMAQGGCMWWVLLPTKNLLPFLRMDLYLRLTGLIAAGVALFLAPGDVGHAPG